MYCIILQPVAYHPDTHGKKSHYPMPEWKKKVCYMRMVQLVESSPMLSAIDWESKRLWLTRISQAHFAWSVWMTNIHCHQQGGENHWLSPIKIMAPAMIRLGPPHPQLDPSPHFHYHHDIFSLITLDLNAVIMELDLKA